MTKRLIKTNKIKTNIYSYTSVYVSIIMHGQIVENIKQHISCHMSTMFLDSTA